MVLQIMTSVAEWSEATECGPSGPSTEEEDDALGRPEQAWAVVEEAPVASGTDADFSLTALVRQWMTMTQDVAGQAKPRREEPIGESRWTIPLDDLPDVASGQALEVTSLTRVEPVEPVEPVGPPEPAEPLIGAFEAPPARPSRALPRRRRQPRPRRAGRLAVLIDAETTTADSVDRLFDTLAGHGNVRVCRAYGDWTSPESRGWSSPLRKYGIQPHHQFGPARDQRALVALTIDAVDLARESAVDVVAIVGDLTSAHPLVMRLNAAGIQVLAFGTEETPYDVRALCHEFVDLSSLGELSPGRGGRHRA
jgi:hypothetical protein